MYCTIHGSVWAIVSVLESTDLIWYNNIILYCIIIDYRATYVYVVSIIYGIIIHLHPPF